MTSAITDMIPLLQFNYKTLQVRDSFLYKTMFLMYFSEHIIHKDEGRIIMVIKKKY